MNPQPQMAGAAPHGAGMSRNAWIVTGIVILVALVAVLVARTLLQSGKAPLSLPGKLTPTQVVVLKALEARYRQEEAAQPALLSAEQITALQRLESGNP